MNLSIPRAFIPQLLMSPDCKCLAWGRGNVAGVLQAELGRGTGSPVVLYKGSYSIPVFLALYCRPISIVLGISECRSFAHFPPGNMPVFSLGTWSLPAVWGWTAKKGRNTTLTSFTIEMNSEKV